MSTHAAIMINAVPCITEMRYLELGTSGGNTIEAVLAAHRVGVDNAYRPRGHVDEFFGCSTDDFFLSNNDQFDVIFIDAGHCFEQVVRDFENALSRAKWGIFIHDLWPPRKEYVSPDWCGDGYRLLRSLVHGSVRVATLNVDYGLTCVRMPCSVEIDRADVSLNQFEDDMAAMQYKRLTVGEMTEWIRKG